MSYDRLTKCISKRKSCKVHITKKSPFDHEKKNIKKTLILMNASPNEKTFLLEKNKLVSAAK